MLTRWAVSTLLSALLMSTAVFAQTPAESPAVPTVPSSLPPVPVTRASPVAAPPMLVSMWWGRSFDVSTIPVNRWYGWQTVVATSGADLATAIPWIVYQGRGDSTAVALPGVFGHFLAGPLVHAAHGHWGKSLAALTFNFTIMSFGLGAGIFAESRVPMAIGYFAGPVLDIALLSTETVRDGPLPVRRAVGRQDLPVAIVPVLDASRRGLLLVGQF